MNSVIDNVSTTESNVCTNISNVIDESTGNGQPSDDSVVITSLFESSFPHKLHHILQNSDFKDIITWMPDGCSWKMLDRKEFANRVLPLYFRHQKFTSFKRQLCGWDFSRGIKESSADEYYHPLFARDQPDLLFQMRRRKQKPRNTNLIRNDKIKNEISSPDILPTINSNVCQIETTPAVVQSHHLGTSLTGQSTLLHELLDTMLGLGHSTRNENENPRNARVPVHTDPSRNNVFLEPDYLRAYRSINQAMASSIQPLEVGSGLIGTTNTIGNSVCMTNPTTIEAVIIAEIERLRRLNNVRMLSIVQNGLVPPFTQPTLGGSIPCRDEVSVTNANSIANQNGFIMPCTPVSDFIAMSMVRRI